MKITEQRVVKIDLSGPMDDLGASVAQSLPSYIRHRYVQRLTFTLEDGRQVTSYSRQLTKPKLAKDIERDMRLVEEGNLFASFHDDEYWGTVRKYGLISTM